MSSCQKYFSTSLLATALLAATSSAWAQDFTVLAGTAVTCTAGSITGDVGIANGTAATPFTNTGCAFVGTAHVNDPAAKNAYAGFVSSYLALAPKTTDVCPVITGTLAGTILAPGTYCVSSEAKTGVLTLDGTSNPNGTWTIKVPSGALTGTNFSVVMAGGAQACNVTWWVDAAATMTTSNLKGNLLTGADITVTGGTFVKGDAFAGGDGSSFAPTGAVTLTGGTVVGCEAGSPGPGPGPQPDPRSCSDRVTGGGTITVNGGKANFGVTGGIRKGKPRGHLTYIDHGKNLEVKGTGVTAYEEIDATTRFIAGTARIDGKSGTYTVTVSDKGEPGKNDTFAIRLFDAAGKLTYSASGKLAGGNVQLHKRHCDKGHKGHHGHDQGDDEDDGDGDDNGDDEHGDDKKDHKPTPKPYDNKRS